MIHTDVNSRWCTTHVFSDQNLCYSSRMVMPRSFWPEIRPCEVLKQSYKTCTYEFPIGISWLATAPKTNSKSEERHPMILLLILATRLQRVIPSWEKRLWHLSKTATEASATGVLVGMTCASPALIVHHSELQSDVSKSDRVSPQQNGWHLTVCGSAVPENHRFKWGMW